MRVSILFAALVLLGLASTSVSAGEISRSQLAQIGLPGMKIMSPEKAMQIRGTGFSIAIAAGSSHVPGGVSTGPYFSFHSMSASGFSASYTVGIGLGGLAGGGSSVSVH